MRNIDKEIAESLLQIKAIKLQPSSPFTWASGWKSPIYCDNRKTLSYPKVRKLIKESFVKVIEEKYGKPDVIAGVATGAIAIGMLVAEAMELPFVYVRPKPKEHGLGNQIEGEVPNGKNVLVIEDLISTGKSSLNAVKALREQDINVLGMVAIFTYGFDAAKQNFEEHKVELTTLSNYNILIEIALNSGYVKPNQLQTLKEWRENPANWG